MSNIVLPNIPDVPKADHEMKSFLRSLKESIETMTGKVGGNLSLYQLLDGGKSLQQSLQLSLEPQLITVTSFLNSWVSAGSPYIPVCYYKGLDNIVHVFGRLQSGTLGSPAFTFPNGFRALATFHYPVISNNAFGKLIINADGNCTPTTPSVNNWVQLDGITFLAG